MNLSEWIHYFDHEGQLHLLYTPGTRVFRDGTLRSPRWGRRMLSPARRKTLALYIENATQECYEEEITQ